MKPALKSIAVYLLLSTVLAGIVLLQWLAVRPTSWIGWVLLWVLVVPVTLTGEFIGERLFDRNPLMQAAERRTRGQGLSGLRVLTALILSLALLGALLGFRLLFASN